VTTVAAAPTGARVGICAASDGHHQIMITVAPKPWRQGASQRASLTWPAASTHLAVGLYETDRIHAADRTTAELLLRCLRHSWSTAPDADQRSSLLTPEISPDRRETWPPLAPSLQQETTTDFLRLLDRLAIRVFEPEQLHGAQRRSPLHRPLLYRRFLSDVTSRAALARRGYRSVVRSRASVRGRPLTQSLLRYAATGDPRLTYRYDELTQATPLLRVIVTALEWIADGRSVASPYTNEYGDAALRRDAVRVRRFFTEVDALPAPVAAPLAARLRLNRLEQPWEPHDRWLLPSSQSVIPNLPNPLPNRRNPSNCRSVLTASGNALCAASWSAAASIESESSESCRPAWS